MRARDSDSQWQKAVLAHQAYLQGALPEPESLSSGSSPRAHSASSSVANQSIDSHTIYASSVEEYQQEHAPSPKREFHHPSSYPYSVHRYGSMNQAQPYLDGHAPGSAPASSMPQYPGYGHPQHIQPASHSYAPAYPQYSYSTMAPMQPGHPVTSSMGGQMVPQQSLPLPTMQSNAPPPAQPGSQQYSPSFDTTGQIAPPGMKPRVTATLWEDEGSLCFQVEANGVCVARREDNHMINGTKLLNVAGMTRGRRDGILKSEKTRHVVKIGPMHLKGVW